LSNAILIATVYTAKILDITDKFVETDRLELRKTASADTLMKLLETICEIFLDNLNKCCLSSL